MLLDPTVLQVFTYFLLRQFFFTLTVNTPEHSLVYVENIQFLEDGQIFCSCHRRMSHEISHCAINCLFSFVCYVCVHICVGICVGTYAHVSLWTWSPEVDMREPSVPFLYFFYFIVFYLYCFAFN